MVYSIINLTPYLPDRMLNGRQELVRFLTFLKFLCQQAIYAIEAFLSGKYYMFDAQASENLCQIRACQMLNVVQSAPHVLLSGFLEDIENALTNCAGLLSKYIDPKICNVTPRDMRTSIISLTEKCGLNVSLEKETIFLIQAYVLSKFKIIGAYGVSHGIDYTAFCNALGMESKTFARKCVHQLQRGLSKLSTQFVLGLMDSSSRNNYHRNLARSLYFTDEVGRHVLPCYEVTKILLDYLSILKQPILISATRLSVDEEEEMNFFLEYCSRRDRYVLSTIKNASKYNGVIRFFGISKRSNGRGMDYISKFMEIGLENVVLCNMAQHSQYPGIRLDDKKYNPYSFLDRSDYPGDYCKFLNDVESSFLGHKYLAKKIGCSLDNDDFFLLTHIMFDAYSSLPTDILGDIMLLKNENKVNEEA